MSTHQEGDEVETSDYPPRIPGQRRIACRVLNFCAGWFVEVFRLFCRKNESSEMNLLQGLFHNPKTLTFVTQETSSQPEDCLRLLV
jgi:hypothetical protein